MPQSSRSFRHPGFLRVSPVDAFQQIAHLPGRDRHRPVYRVRPDEPAPLQPFHEQTAALAVMPDHLHQVTSAAPEDEQLTAVWVLAEALLNLQGQAHPPLAHVRVPGGQPDPHARRNRDHGARLDVASVPSTAAAKAGSTAPSRRTRAPSGNMTSRTAPAMAAGADGGSADGKVGDSDVSGSGVTVTGTKVGRQPVGGAALISRRHRYSRLSWIPSRRATSFTITPGRKASSTIRTFSAGG